MENVQIVLSLAGTAFSLLVACVVFIANLINCVKRRKAIEDSFSLLNAVGPLMELAEQHSNYTGEEKKDFVLTKLNQFSIDNGIDYDAKVIADKIEELIKLSKQVNSKN